MKEVLSQYSNDILGWRIHGLRHSKKVVKEKDGWLLDAAKISQYWSPIVASKEMLKFAKTIYFQKLNACMKVICHLLHCVSNCIDNLLQLVSLSFSLYILKWIFQNL